MVRAIVAFVLVVLLLSLGGGTVPSTSMVATDSRATSANADLPHFPPGSTAWGRGFTQNLGQLSDSHVRFYSSSMWPQVGFAPNEVVFLLARSGTSYRAVLVRAAFENANPVEPMGVEKLAYSTNFFKGLDLARSETEVPSFGQVAYRGLYDGIDLVYAATPSGTKYEFLLAPGATVADIAIRFDGADSIELDAAGNLVAHTAAGDLV